MRRTAERGIPPSRDDQECIGGHNRQITNAFSHADVNLLDNIVQNFGMLDLVKKVLARHKSQMDHYREQYTQSLAGEGSD